jgi:hypothetical protein
MVFAKSNFQNGGANPCRAVASRRRMPVCLDSPQGIATISEITFGNQSMSRIELELRHFVMDFAPKMKNSKKRTWLVYNLCSIAPGAPVRHNQS